FPEPVISVAVEAKSSADQDKMMSGLEKLVKEDPSARLRNDPETGQTLLSGMGELHLEILVDRLLREHKIQANVGKPQVSYRETISARGQASHTYERQIAGEDLYAFVEIEVEPQSRGAGLAFANAVQRVTPLPAHILRAIEAGFRESAEVGPIASYGLIDFKANLKKVEFRDEKNASEIAYKAATSLALRDAVRAAKPVLLEPVFKLEVTCPDNFVGNVVGDLNSRRGKVHSMSVKAGGGQIISADAPLATLFGYATDLRSLTQGRASFSMEFKEYYEIPPKVRDELLQRMGRF
ncbi:MAG: elongation factor G, partial [Pseudobdellovibrionaceae bacterium]